jgi:HD superfamily phosphohydrolase
MIEREKSMNSKFIEQLKEKYDKLEKKVPEECDVTYGIICEIEKSLKGRYEIVRPIDIGGTGIVIQVIDCNLHANRALKLSRPIIGREEDLGAIMVSEIKCLCEVTHQNIISVFYTGEIRYNNKLYFYYIMEYIDEAVNGVEYINNDENRPNYNELILFLIQWVSGLKMLHENGIIHGDVKLENILVSKKSLLAKVSDLGSARLLSSDDGTTNMAFTRKYAHPELIRLLDGNSTDPNRVMVKFIDRSTIKPVYDLFSLGKNIFGILNIKKYKDGILITEYQRNYLTLMAARLLDGENSPNETFLTIPPKGMKQIKYTNIEEVLIDLKKANGEYLINEIIPELNIHSKKTIQVSSSEINTFTDRVSNLLNTKLVSRLANITQLGLMVYVYPTAVHTRLEHVLGTMLNVTRYIDALWHDPINPFFKQVISDKDIKTLLVAALLHDIGQYPLAHDFEEADHQLFSHSNNTKRLLLDKNIIKTLEPILRDDWDLKIEDIFSILDIDTTADNKTYKEKMLRSIIDGPIDADKLDYLVRDANNLNIPYGKAIDYSKIIRSLTVVFERDPVYLSPVLGIHEKGKIAAEGVAFARYAMFGAVYWHHTIRAIKAMLHRAVWEALPDFSDRRSKEYKAIQDDIFNEINDQLLNKEQPWLIDTDTNKLKFTGNINLYDFKLISYFYKKTSYAGKELLQMICERKIFKRLFIISASKAEDAWGKIFEIRNSNDWRRWLVFQENFENLLIQKIHGITKEQRNISAMSHENTNRIDSLLSSKTPLFLIDIPIPRSGSKYPLQYLHEVRFANSIQYNPDEMIQPEDSIIWKSIAGDLSKSIGKARIFCHPDIINTASVFYTGEVIEKAIDSAWRKAKDI